jgi:hypothetical protein
MIQMQIADKSGHLDVIDTLSPIFGRFELTNSAGGLPGQLGAIFRKIN